MTPLLIRNDERRETADLLEQSVTATGGRVQNSPHGPQTSAEFAQQRACLPSTQQVDGLESPAPIRTPLPPDVLRGCCATDAKQECWKSVAIETWTDGVTEGNS